MTHSDYTLEFFPKFEIFADRIEITLFGGLPQGMNEMEFLKIIPFLGIRN